MSTVIDKEWAAIRGDEILHKEDHRPNLIEWLWDNGVDKNSVDIVALPKAHTSIFI